MGCRWIYSMPVRTLLLIVGVALITLGIAEGKNILWVVGVISCVASVLVFRKCNNNYAKRVG